MISLQTLKFLKCNFIVTLTEEPLCWSFTLPSAKKFRECIYLCTPKVDFKIYKAVIEQNKHQNNNFQKQLTLCAIKFVLSKALRNPLQRKKTTLAPLLILFQRFSVVVVVFFFHLLSFITMAFILTSFDLEFCTWYTLIYHQYFFFCVCNIV